MKDFETKESNISGKWIFALRDFKKDELVIDWSKCSKIISREIFENLSENEKNFVQIRDNKYVYFSSPASFMNHSCNPNAEPRDIWDFAIRDIKKWEEVTISYFWEDWDWGFVCNCWKCLII